jgi:hypothetical protein
MVALGDPYVFLVVAIAWGCLGLILEFQVQRMALDCLVRVPFSWTQSYMYVLVMTLPYIWMRSDRSRYRPATTSILVHLQHHACKREASPNGVC